jgi:hypothetical protein
VVVAVLDGHHGVVDDLLVDLVKVTALELGGSEAITELGGAASSARCVRYWAWFLSYHGDFIPVAQLEWGDILGLLGSCPRRIGLESGRLRVHLGE